MPWDPSVYMGVFIICIGFMTIVGVMALLVAAVIYRDWKATEPLDMNDEERACVLDDNSNLMMTNHRRGFKKTQKAA